MKNLKHRLFQAFLLCLIAVITSCEKSSIDQENIDLSSEDKADKIEKYDEYTVRMPKKDGKYFVARNEKTGNKLSYELRDTFITSFQISSADGKVVVFDKLVIPTAGNLPPWRPNCPDGWDEKLICYVNDDGILVSYTRCTPTSFTIGLEPEW
ncbi:hypothetical protein [Aquimarina litoralis]|uniref:hypothetical protein n=1 Tax=Aquimarina litoralis TaxID=584605 RepID=UPI001C597168|nr:hypothetical protein [Aquimarina litoralis]MBW1297784.1 hypothetical protein [Aquimarina litoralis]